MAKLKGLGRGLESLLASGDAGADDKLTSLNVAQIRPGRYQPRLVMDDDELADLAESIRAQGLIQPVIVRELGLSDYELIAGERRWRACQLAGLTEIPAVIKAVNDEAALAMGIIENIQRADLNPIEEAMGFKRLIDEFGLTHEALAHAVGRSRSGVSNSLRLLSLPNQIQDMVAANQLEMGHARVLVALPILGQLELAAKAVEQGWSVREIEQQAASWSQSTAAYKTPKMPNQDLLRLQEMLAEQLGLKVSIQANQKQKGKLVLHFNNIDEFQHLLSVLKLEEMS
ncbi:chromosome-partitioning protein ParB [Vitreoscilla sp. C1]|uniref:ParB/RepB/Spo0J family partition protein n=1 Tax=Vitreoscilla sp. (strain C1) TaxID=96942 RepID=UPI000CDC60DC|nr:ParB/RepB/Spo0J family partition protein [Vitreoscilla sp. C1]AUZ06004.1 chromosome-partitioning protein ParB [Vitreoscilla sp. C1]